MKRATKIVLSLAEGRSDELGAVTIEPRHDGNVWTVADRVLQGWSQSCSEGSHNKCDFTVTYEDGEQYDGCLLLTRGHARYNSIIADHMEAFRRYGAGTEVGFDSFDGFYGEYEIGRWTAPSIDTM